MLKFDFLENEKFLKWNKKHFLYSHTCFRLGLNPDMCQFWQHFWDHRDMGNVWDSRNSYHYTTISEYPNTNNIVLRSVYVKFAANRLDLIPSSLGSQRGSIKG